MTSQHILSPPRLTWRAGVVLALALAVIVGPTVDSVAAASTARHGPAISALTASRHTVADRGGAVTINARVRRAQHCRLTSSPRLAGLPRNVSCAHGHVVRTLQLPANKGKSRRNYALTLQASARHHRSVTKRITLSVLPPPTCPGKTSGIPPRTAAYFNDPATGNSRERNAVVDAMVNLICDVSAPVSGRPSEIDVAALNLSLPQVSDALVWAHEYRHAVVRVALDGGNAYTNRSDAARAVPSQAYLRLRTGLPTGSVVLCGPNAGRPVVSTGEQDLPGTRGGTSCAGDNILHTKLLLVSSVDAAHDPAVFVTSQNLDSAAENQAFNNGVQLVGNRGTYTSYEVYFRKLLSNTRDPDLGGTLTSAADTQAGLSAQSYYFPRNSTGQFPVDNTYDAVEDQATDTVAQTLDGVSCWDPGDYAGDHSVADPRTTVRVAIFDYQHREQITTELESLAAEGCDVQVLYAEMGSAVRDELVSGGITPVQLSVPELTYTGGFGSGRVFVHDKYVLISGGYATPGSDVQQNQDIVLTGSENWTQNALHDNDDTILTLTQTATASAASTPIYTAFAANWLHLDQIATSAGAAQ